jgi:hypothetical protein
MLIDLAWTEKRLRERHAFTAVTNHTGNQSLSLQQRPDLPPCARWCWVSVN